MPTNRTASEIAEDLLARTGDAMDRGDFDSFERCFSRPVIMETLDEKLLLQTREDMRRTFDAVRKFRRENGVIKALRENISAEFIDENTITTTHVSRMMGSDNTAFGQPYVAHSLARRSGDTWLIHFCQYAAVGIPQLNAALGTHKAKDAVQSGGVFQSL